ncbi:prephenate dehydrogenase [Leekyejoonella antrihumi]|uniref:Prephenate dehydrogenase n=1 Tax=Leekyejoonella antrihumi TaxID=1660198 RepID=A0A563E2C3_9MICO|nr:prephenate dehydrogenase [Leekyejoonella antrihumi]TWP36687.1 prephenate dehydrogenase [Leekyejoonella antrihumi]
MTPQHVRVVGTGLIGASIGLALRAKGVRVSLHDPSPTARALARDIGAGELDVMDEPDVVVVAAPPDVVSAVVADELKQWPTAVVTDVASVKARVLAQVRATVDPAELRRYVGSHPMAGRERSGAVAAQGDLFEGRTWVVCPAPESDPVAVTAVQHLASDCGAATVTMPASDHDLAVASVSHVPQIAASLVAARLRDISDEAIALSGQGVRDVTRIAASDPMLWTQILAGNATAVAPVIDLLAQDLRRVSEALQELGPEASPAEGARGVLARVIADGALGHARIPGKHGAAPTAYGTLLVIVPDQPGALGRLFNDMGDAGINLEDLRLEHGVGAQVGIAEVSVLPAVMERLKTVLEDNGWSVHE